MAKHKSNPDHKPQSFEDALSQLAAIVTDLEDGAVGLEESLQRFEEGMGLLRHCHQILSSAEQRIEQLTGFDADGNPLTEPLDGVATIDQRKESAGRRQRSPRKDANDEDSAENETPGPRLF